MHDIGLGMIVRDEAEVLEGCLRSVQGLVDQLVIVDTGSNDETPDIARRFGAKVLQFEWIDTYRPNFNFGFAAARNFCWDHLDTHWKMWLDADDLLLGREYFEEMLQKLEDKPGLEGVILEYLYSFTSEGEQLLDRVTPDILAGTVSSEAVLKSLQPTCITTQHRERIVLNSTTLRWQYPVHEAISTVGHWFGRYDSVKVLHRRHIKRGAANVNERNWKLIQQIPLSERNERIWFYLAMEHAQKNEIDEAIGAFTEYLNRASVDDEKYFALHYLADLHRRKNLWEESKTYDLKAMAIRPTWRDAYAGMLASCVGQEDWKQALYYGARCAQAEIPDTPFAYNPFIESVGWTTSYVTALTQFGMMEEALRETERALQILPNDPGLLHNLDLISSELNLRHGTDSVADVLEFLLRIDDGETAAMLISRLHAKLQKHPRITKLTAQVDRACSHAARGEILPEPLIRDGRLVEEAGLSIYHTPEIWYDRRMRYVCDHIARNPWVQDVLQVGGPIESDGGYRDLGVHGVRVEHTEQIQGSYDLVVLWNCLERVRDPELIVSKARDCLRPGGGLIGFVSYGPAHKALAPAEQVPVRFRAYSVDTFRQVMGTIKMPTLLPGQVAVADQMALAAYLPIPSRPKRVAIYCLGAPEPWGPASLDQGIGGSEEAAIRLSRAFARRGHQVSLYGTGWTGTEYDGQIVYRTTREYEPSDVLIGWRHPEVFGLPLEAEWKALWLHDSIPPERVRSVEQVIDCVWAISKYHAAIYAGIANVHEGRNGIDPEMFEQGEIERNPAKLVYVSTPFRGLDRLALKFWPEIKRRIPQAEIHAYYGWESADRMGVTRTPEGAEFKKRLMAAFDADPALVWHGRVGQPELYREMLSAGVLAYPSSWREESCISAMIAQGAGAWPVVSPQGALPQTVVFGWYAEDHEYVDAVCDAVLSDLTRGKMMAWARRWLTWDGVASDWERLWRGLPV